ncbi:hypothetical protein Tco_0149206 [Tanacetum coccineum]
MEEFPAITGLLDLVIDDLKEDKIRWKMANDDEIEFSMQNVCCSLRDNMPEGVWGKSKKDMRLKSNATSWSESVHDMASSPYGNTI